MTTAVRADLLPDFKPVPYALASLEVLSQRVWKPVICGGKRKKGTPCQNIIGYTRTGYVSGSFATMCKRCRKESVIA